MAETVVVSAKLELGKVSQVRVLLSLLGYTYLTASVCFQGVHCQVIIPWLTSLCEEFELFIYSVYRNWPASISKFAGFIIFKIILWVLCFTCPSLEQVSFLFHLLFQCWVFTSVQALLNGYGKYTLVKWLDGNAKMYWYINDTEKVDISDVSVATTVICFPFH